MKLYRGLNLNKLEIELIKEAGDQEYEKGSWLLLPTISFHNLLVDEVINKISKEPDDIVRYYNETKDINKLGKYAASCFEGASIYSNGNKDKELNVVLEIEAIDDRVFIDGRDFLYHIMYRTILHDIKLDKEQLDKLKMAFGEKIIEYINKGKILSKRDNNIINRFTDYICMDRTIINAHYLNNKILIQGKYSTQFFGAFAIIGGISPEMIKDIKPALNLNKKTPPPIIKDNIEVISLKDFF